MFRPRPRVHSRVLLAAALAAVVAGCSGGAEKPVLNRFFTASRLRDLASLRNFSIVSFEPRTDGIVTSFTIASVTPEQGKAVDARVLALSIDDPRTPFDPAKDDVELVSKDVTVSAPVKLPSGATSSRIPIVTMQRGVVKGDQPRTGRWIVTAIKDAAAFPSRPPRR